MTKHCGVALLVMAGLGGVALLVMAGLTRTNGLNGVAAAEPQGTGPEITNDQVFAMVFLAVLEGQYLDGASNEAVEAIICPDPKTGQPRFHEHFVDACPLCNPTFNALVVYRSRPSFYGYQMPKDTLGPGLKPELVRQLRSAKAPRGHPIPGGNLGAPAARLPGADGRPAGGVGPQTGGGPQAGNGAPEAVTGPGA